MSRTNAEVADADLVHVAWHEAGHTVVSYLLGARSIEVSVRDMVIDRTQARGGTTLKSGGPQAATNLWSGYFGAIESIPIMLAGYFAERWVNTDRRLALKGAELDFTRVRMLDPYTPGPKVQGFQWLKLMYPTPSVFRRFLIGQVRLTVRLLEEHETVVQVLAELLLERGELSPAEVSEIGAALIDSGPKAIRRRGGEA